MICIIALVIFGIMGIFSASHRKIAVKAFDCVFRRVTLRACNSGLDQQLKTSIISFFSKKNVKAARFVAKNFEILSWIFTILMILSIFFSARGVYFYFVYGNCNGENSDQFCIFDALAPTDSSTCTDPSVGVSRNFTTPSADDDPSIGPLDAKVTIIEFGCFSCPYTKKAEPVVQQLLKEYNGRIMFVYRDFLISQHGNSKERAIAAECAKNQSMYWQYHKLLFEKQEQNLTTDILINMAQDLGLNSDVFKTCIASEEIAKEVDKDFEDGKASGVYGTPTFFINDKVVVGPKPLRYFENIINGELNGKKD